MDAKQWIKRGIEILLALTLPIAMTSVVAQGQEEADLPSAVGQLSEYYASTAMMAGYPTYPGENLPLYPGDEKWNGHYVMPAYAGTAPASQEASSGSIAVEPGVWLPNDEIDVHEMATNGVDIFAGITRKNEDGIVEDILAQWGGNIWYKWASVNSSSYLRGIEAVEMSGSNIYIGGTFNEVSNLAANNIAHWNGSKWQALGKGVYNTINGYYRVVNTIAVAPNGVVYAGGNFNRAGEVAVNNIARWDGVAWQDMGGGVDGPVYAIAVMGNNVYVGGYFTKAGGQPALNIARWDGTSWHAVGSGMVSRMIQALEVEGKNLYAGGYANVVDSSGEPRVVPLILRWDGTDWYSLGSGPETWGGGVTSIEASGSVVYIGGRIHGSDGQHPINNIAYWDGAQWWRMGSGTDIGVDHLLLVGDQLYASGIFDLAGNNRSTGLASWHRMPELIPYYYWDMYGRGMTLYLIGNYFTADQPAQLSVNGVVLEDEMVTNADGKIYIHLQTSQDAEPGLYEVKLTVGNESAVWWLRLGSYESTWVYDYDGYIVTLPASLPPLSESYLPLITK